MTDKTRKIKLKTIYRAFQKTTRTTSFKKKAIVSLITFGLIFLVFYTLFLFKDIPNPTSLTKGPGAISTQILDRNGKLLYEVYREQNRNPIKIADLPDYVKQATISIEDKNFYRHFGLDFLGIARAAFNTLTGRRLEGGSTITQQLVKNTLLADPKRTITRKIREAVLSLITEVVYSKDQILELYLNYAPYGGTAYGIETAAGVFFNKSARDLTLAEDAYISQEQAAAAKTEKLNFATKRIEINAPHFALWVRDFLVDKYGEDLVNLGGLRVTTSLDLSLQEYAQASLSAEIKKLGRLKISNGAALVTKPATGEILAMIGSADYFNLENDGNVNVTTRPRQPGSSIKPLNYAVGLMTGWTATTMFLDLPTCFSVTAQPLYCPKNYDNTFRGATQMRFALGNSLNIPAVKMLALNGLESFVATASAMGISTFTDPSRYGLSLTLGGGEVTMADMAVAFGTFANAGVTVPLNPILKVETFNGQVLEEFHPDEVSQYVSSLHENWTTFWRRDHPFVAELASAKVRVTLPEEVAYIISDVLADNNARQDAFGPNSQLVIPGRTVSVKTGTR